MEASIIVEGFKLSEEIYGVRYAKFIGDGDSNVYKQLLQQRPYKNLTVQKWNVEIIYTEISVINCGIL